MATIPAVGSASYPTPDELRDALLRTIRTSYDRNGLVANVLPGSDHYVRMDAVSKRLAVAFANSKIALADINPLTVTGEKLTELCRVFGVSRRPAASASGYVTIISTATVTIPSGFRCTAPSGHKYATTSANTVASGATVEVQAVTTGAATDQDAGTVLTWDSAAIGALSQTCTVGVLSGGTYAGDLDGGTDDDTDETLRTRLLNRLAFPAVGGNWASVKGWAEEATSSVEAAYVYPAVRGPGSYDVAITAAGGDRSLSATIVSDVAAYILGKAAGHASLNVTSVLQQQADVVIALTLPLPTHAGGAGGGWKDATPFPRTTAVKCTAFVEAGSPPVWTATLNSTTSPVKGQRIAVWNPSDQTMAEYTIDVVGGGVGAWTVTITSPWLFSPLNHYISAACVNLQEYATAFYDAVLLLGPGEKSTSPDIVPRGSRHPGPDVSNPSDLTATLLSGAINRDTYPEVLDISYVVRYATGTTNALTSPSLPATASAAPRILTLNRLAFIRA